MKTNLKILHEVPDLDKLSARHQDFDALMDAVTDEKIRKRKKFYKAGSFVLVIMATAFLSWLYWGYEPAGVEEVAKQQAEVQPPAKENVMPVEEKEPTPEATVVPETATAEPGEKEQEVVETEAVVTQSTPPVAEKEEEEIASPQVIIREKVTADAAPLDGLENLYRYLYQEIELPDSVLKTDETFFLEVEFEVGKAGEIGEVSFNKELPAELEASLSKVFLEMPAWKPALELGDSIASVINLPITFLKKGGKQ